MRFQKVAAAWLEMRAMPTIEFLREKARQCRELVALVKNPEVVAQLEMWALEFEEEAARAATDAAVLVIAPAPPVKSS
jgi:hypothetical protein